MSIFGDIANAVSGAVNFVADAVSGAAQGVAKLADGVVGGLMDLGKMALGGAFPMMELGNALANFATAGVGEGLMKAIDILGKEAGLPKFLGDKIKDFIKDFVNTECGGKPTTPQCEDAVKDKCGTGDGGNDIKNLIEDMIKNIVDFCKDRMGGDDEKCGGGKGKGKSSASSWLEAIAQAMGDAAGKQAEKLVKKTQELDDLNTAASAREAGGGQSDPNQQAADARETTKIQSEIQAASQLMSILQNSFANALKSIGEGMTTMGRKG